jgi:glucose/arabinose dehydrogenase
MQPSRTRFLVPVAMALLIAFAVFQTMRPQRGGRSVREGQALFQRRCALCHATGQGGGQGPGLGGVVGRVAASAPGFGYSRGLRASGLTWDGPTLDRFLAAPAQVVPGTTMPQLVRDARERRMIIAFLATLQGTALRPAGALHLTAAPPAAAPGLRTGTAAFGSYHDDGPGVRRRITMADLPPPYATPAPRNSPSVVDIPPDARPVAPPGFNVARFATNLEGPRALRVAPNGDVFVAESLAGRVRVLRARDGATSSERSELFAKDLDRPFGIAFFPPGAEPRWVYVAENNAVVRFAYQPGDVPARAAPETVVPKLAEDGHYTRDIAFSRDGTQMFVSIGSESNVAEDMPRRSSPEILDWEASHGLGASWGDETWRADVMVFNPEGKGGRAFATGIRNCVGLAVSPVTGDPWCSTNERDGLGDNLVPDYVTRVKESAFYGWPWYYIGAHEDPRHAGERPDLAGKVTAPDVLLQPHSASLEIAFYDGPMFPPEYRGNVFAALHGSWNRALRTGYKVVRAIVSDGIPTGEYEDFLTGFVLDDDEVWGRPVGVAVAHDGALLVSEDGNGTIWRVSYDRRD